MAVSIFGGQMDVDGFASTMVSFRRATKENAQGVINAHEGRPLDFESPPYDPKHPDNEWPKSVYHPVNGHRTVGKSTKGLEKPHADKVKKDNEEEMAAMLGAGHRVDPYIKPVASAETAAVREKALMDQVTSQGAQIAQLADLVMRLTNGMSVPNDKAKVDPPKVDPFFKDKK